MSLVFYAAPASSSSPVACALLELGVPHERINLDLPAREQRKPEFLALNPNGKVPTLVIDGTPLFEALAILHWLGDEYGIEKGLWPARGTPARLRALSWTTWAYVTYGGALQRLVHSSSERIPAERHNAALAAATKEELQQLLGLLDAQLAGQPYLLGSAFSLADLILCSVVNYGVYCGASAQAHPALTRWLERCGSRPSLRSQWI
ncbi:MAG TPA: glutathione S-transferase family protein [Polyangiaceae bacterium]|nr:glutathione S-transferase family protein [Polyangiaceae bacterium]